MSYKITLYMCAGPCQPNTFEGRWTEEEICYGNLRDAVRQGNTLFLHKDGVEDYVISQGWTDLYSWSFGNMTAHELDMEAEVQQWIR
jgi:hypothetical protein